MEIFLPKVAEYFSDITAHPLQSFIIVLNLVLIESLLSIDNAAVLATMVMDLKNEERTKALRYGIWGAYFFRGIAMIFASFIIQIWWLKLVGGLYLLYLVYDWWKSRKTLQTEDDLLNKNDKKSYQYLSKIMSPFWATVVLVEIMDMAFSIDNVFAAVAFSPNILLVCLGVFIGILAMRFVANYFVSLMEKHPYLETSAFVVIGILGLKLCLSVIEHLYPESKFSQLMSSHQAEIFTSVLTISIFFLPILVSKLKINKSK